MGLFKKLFKRKEKNKIPPSTWLPTPPPVTDYDRHTPRHEIITVKVNKSDLNKYTLPKKEPDLTHLDKNGELPFGWVYANRDFIEKIEAQNNYFSEAYYNVNKSLDVRKNYAALKSQILFWKDTKKLCQSKGECFEKWCSDIIADEDLINQREEELKYIEDNMERLLKNEELKKNMRNDVLSLIIYNDGVLQTDIYKSYPQELKDSIIEEISALCQDGVIYKEKSGRTYALHLVGLKSLPH